MSTCKTCRWYAFDDYVDDHYCANSKSKYYTNYIRAVDNCDKHEVKDDRHPSNTKIHTSI